MVYKLSTIKNQEYILKKNLNIPSETFLCLNLVMNNLVVCVLVKSIGVSMFSLISLALSDKSVASD